jgi:ribosome-binding factor A
MAGRPRRRAGGGAGGRSGASAGNAKGYARTARVNEVLRQVLAEHIERLAELDERLGILTVTAVQCDPDMRRAAVLLATLSPAAAEALAEARIRLQKAIASEVRLHHTPQLTFSADPVIAEAQRIEDILRVIPPPTEHPDPEGPPGAGPAEDPQP